MIVVHSTYEASAEGVGMLVRVQWTHQCNVRESTCELLSDIFARELKSGPPIPQNGNGPDSEVFTVGHRFGRGRCRALSLGERKTMFRRCDVNSLNSQSESFRKTGFSSPAIYRR